MSELPAPDINQDKLLLAQNLEVSYGVTQVLWGISFSVARGKVTCIIDPMAQARPLRSMP